MTSENILRLNKKFIAAVGDEREQQGGRLYDVAKKIHPLPYNSSAQSTKGIICYSGSVPNGDAILKEMKCNVRHEDKPEQILNKIQEAYKKIRNDTFQRGVLDAYSITPQNFLSLVVEKPDHFLVKKASVEEGDRNFGVILAAGLIEEDDSRIYVVTYPGIAYSLGRHVSIGSGRDRAEIVIGDALHHMQPEERENIPLAKGIRLLMEATRSAWRNAGVGGRSQVVWYDDEKYRELGTEESNLLNNALYFEAKNKLEKRYVNKIFEKIIERGSKASEFQSDLEKKITHKDLVQSVFVDSLQYD